MSEPDVGDTAVAGVHAKKKKARPQNLNVSSTVNGSSQNPATTFINHNDKERTINDRSSLAEDEEVQLNQMLNKKKRKKFGTKKTPKMPYDTIRASRGPMLRSLSLETNNNTASEAAVIRNMDEINSKEKWSSLAKMRSLTIEDEEKVIHELPAQLWNLSKLQHVTLKYLNTHSLTKPMLSGLKRLTNLTRLDLVECNLKSIVGVETLTALVELDVSRNHLHNLPRDFGRLSNLEKLIVRGNKLTSLPPEVGDLKKLRICDCRSNKLEELPEALGNLESLAIIDTSLNHLKVLPLGFLQLKSLNEFSASSNRLSSLPGDLSTLEKLEYIYLSKNRFKEVPIGLGSLSSLKVLHMAHNSIVDVTCEMPNLESLVLNDNHLEKFPESILKSHKLATLSIEDNKIPSLPKEISELKMLRILGIGGNEITHVPDEIGQLAELRHLSLRSTKVQTLPSGVGSLRRLSVLNINESDFPSDVKYTLEKEGIEAFKRHLSEGDDGQKT